MGRLQRSKLLKGLGATVAAAVLTLAAAGCGSGGGGAAGNTASGGALAQAGEPVQALFKASCQSCHGVDLAGRTGPATNLQQVGSKLTKEQIAAQITNGGGNMPSFGKRLKPDEIDALASWLATVK